MVYKRYIFASVMLLVMCFAGGIVLGIIEGIKQSDASFPYNDEFLAEETKLWNERHN